MRRPEGAGGGCCSNMPISQRFNCAVVTRRFQTSCAFMIACCRRSKPRPVLADTVISGAPRNCGNSRSKLSRRSFSLSCFSSSRSHLLTATTTARPSRSARSAIRKSCCSNGISTSSSTTTTSANFTARRPSLTDSFSSFSCTLARLRIPAVSKIRTGTSPHSVITEMASRVIPASGPVSKRSSPMILLINVDLPALGRPTTATCNGRALVGMRGPSSSSSDTSTSVSGASAAARSANSSEIGRSISRSSPMPSPCSADRRRGSPRPSA